MLANITFILISFFIFPKSALAVVINSSTVVEKSYSQSLDAKSYELDRQIAEAGIKEAKSQYDTLLNADVSYADDQSERTTTVFGTKTTSTGFNFGLSQLTPIGSELNLSFLNSRETTDSAFATLGTYFESKSYFEITQPLLNNSFGYQTRKNIQLAKQIKKQTDTKVDSDLMDLACKNLRLYWNWYLNQSLQAIDENALSSALRLLRTNRAKMNIGLIEETDIYAFEANADLKKSSLLETQINLVNAKTDLSVALHLDSDQMELGQENMKSVKYPAVNVMVEHALSHHPKYLTLLHQLKAQDISVAMKKNSRLPRIDLVGSLILNGIDTDYNTAVGDISDGNAIWKSGVSITFPMQNQYARASHKKTTLERMQLLYAIKNLENKIINDVKTGYIKYQKNLSRMQTLSTAVEHQRLKWEGEIKKYDQGRSDPDLVIRYQNDYLDTRRLYLQSQIAYQLAKLDLDYIRGALVP